MGYLLTQMALYMIATFVLGLLLGWLFWRFGRETTTIDAKALEDERDALRRNRDDLNEKLAELRSANAELKAELDACAGRCQELEAQVSAARGMAVPIENAPEPVAVESIEEPAVNPEWKPQGLDGPRDGNPDDLQRIKGIGPKLEQLLHNLGFFHFDQIANWTENEVAWVDQNLEGFYGRVTRDRWIDQAKELMSA